MEYTVPKYKPVEKGKVEHIRQRFKKLKRKILVLVKIIKWFFVKR